MAEPVAYLLEIGTEELPAGFLASAIPELKERFETALVKSRLDYGAVSVLATPRRFSVIIDALASVQPPSDEVLKGPPAAVGLDASGNPTPAAQGFAKKMGVSVTDLETAEIDGVSYLILNKHIAGRSAADVLPELIPDVVLGLSGSHFMSWDDSGIRFSRPLRWLVSLLDEKHLPVKIGHLKSGVKTYGHRFFTQKPEIPLASAADYKTTLWQEGRVMVDQAEREAYIRQGLSEMAKAEKGMVPIDEGLLKTVTLLVEVPKLIRGSFSKHFLHLPKEVITTVMASHQKYFPMEDAKQALLPYFITISNNPEASAEATIRAGNEKVLQARLEDASFFFQEDTRYPLSHYVEALRGITFQKGLGTLYDKTQRLKNLVSKVAALSNLQKYASDAVRAAELCKADLATAMVRELTELQGVVGRHYAQLGGETESVADAICEHYQPRYMGDVVAQSPVGVLVSITDKLDSMMAVFAQKDARYPTGSKDPMGLRRMALGLIQTVVENKLTLDLESAFSAAYHNLGALAVESSEDAIARTRQFLLQRFKGYLLDQQYSYDTIDAVLEADISPFQNLTQTLLRLEYLKTLQQEGDRFKKVYEPANRVSRILGKAYQPTIVASAVDSGLFSDPTEGKLLKAVLDSKPEKMAIAEMLSVFEAWFIPVENFFEKVLVNDEDAAVRENRYALLSLLNKHYRQFADFTKLVV